MIGLDLAGESAPVSNGLRTELPCWSWPFTGAIAQSGGEAMGRTS
jgi:hypothetical protein